MDPDSTKQIPVWPEYSEMQPKLLLAEFVNMDCILGSAAHWGPFIAQSCSSLKPVCPPRSQFFFFFFFLTHALQFPHLLFCLPLDCRSLQSGPVLTQVMTHALLLRSWNLDRHWYAGRYETWAEETVIYRSPQWASQQLHTNTKAVSALTGVGVGWRSLQVRRGVRWWVKAAWGRRGWRQHAGVGGGRLGRNRLRERRSEMLDC